MLAVATFSLSIMVFAFGNVSSSATPRASKLIIENQNAQRAVATFIGAFLYSIVGIIALATHSYGPSGRFVLFLVTIIVVLVIVLTLIKWIDQLSSLGQVENTIAEIEKASLIAIKEYAKDPFLGGQLLEESDIKKNIITSQKVGFVVLIDTKGLQKVCDEKNFNISVIVLPGSFIYPERILATVDSTIDQKTLESIASLFVIEKNRTFKQDPRFGFVILSEIASKALSQGINDPGTAIQVLGCATRLLKMRSDLIKIENSKTKKHNHSRVFVRPLKGPEFIATLFAPIIRDGANKFEVGIKIQKFLKALKSYDPEYQNSCDFYANFTKLHFNSSLKTEYEKDLVEKAWKGDEENI